MAEFHRLMNIAHSNKNQDILSNKTRGASTSNRHQTIASSSGQAPERLRVLYYLRFLTQHRIQHRIVNLDMSVSSVADEAELAEFVHEETNA